MEAFKKAYSKELKSAIIAKMLPPNDVSISKLAKEGGIPEATLHKWRAEARANDYAAPASDAPAERWSSQDKFLIVLETATSLRLSYQSIVEQKVFIQKKLKHGKMLVSRQTVVLQEKLLD